jgi:hypothetical protein
VVLLERLHLGRRETKPVGHLRERRGEESRGEERRGEERRAGQRVSG